MEGSRIALTHVSSIAATAILEKLPESGLAPEALDLLGDADSIGTRLAYADRYLEVQDPQDYCFSDCAVVLMPESDAVIEEKLQGTDTILVSHCITTEEPAIFVAKGDADMKATHTQTRLRLAGPELSCLLGVLPTLHQSFGIKKINLTLLQSAESRGRAAVEELAGQTISLLNAQKALSKVYPLQIAFNLLPKEKTAAFDADLIAILGDSAIRCGHQAIDVPVFHGLAVAVQLEFERDVNPQTCRERLSQRPEIELKKTHSSLISDCNQSFTCILSQFECQPEQVRLIRFWMMADPMRYGLANNYINVMDILLKFYL